MTCVLFLTFQLFFHAGFSIVPGGFLGVDVFFVISGYLITSIIIKSIGDGNFTFSGFYIIRARRILAAFITVVFFSIVASEYLMLPVDKDDFLNLLYLQLALFQIFILVRDRLLGYRQ